MITADRIARDFPSLSNRTYLNTAAEGVPPGVVGEALGQYFADHQLGMDGRVLHARVEGQAREVAARLLGLETEEVAFCSCSAEAYNLLAGALRLKAGDRVVISDLDFPSGATPWLVAEEGKVDLWKAREGALELEDLAGLLSEQTRLVQLSLVSFYNGFRVPLGACVGLIRERAPGALIALDVTQALGRVPLDFGGVEGVDVVVSSTHKWTLGVHGGGIVGVPKRAAERVVTGAGGWYHLSNAFDADRFSRAVVKPGAAGFATGMPSFAVLYALNAALRYLEGVGVEQIEAYANPLTQRLCEGVEECGLVPLARFNEAEPTGIVAFLHERAEGLNAFLRERDIHVMHHAGRIRAAVHGYNTQEDVERFLRELRAGLRGC